MPSTSLIIALSAATLSCTFPPSIRAADPPQDAPAPMPWNTQVPPGTDASPEFDAAARAELEALTAPLPEARRIFTHTYRAGHITTRVDTPDAANAAAHAGLPQEKLIYSNTSGTKIFKFGSPNRRIADDLQTDVISGCDLSRYLVRVNGGVQHGVGEFSCTVSLHSICPSTANGNVLIPGTDAIFTGLTDDNTDYHDLVLDFSLNPIPMDTTFWVRVSCTTAASGWVVGAVPEVGFTKDEFFFPTTGCNSFVGPTLFLGFYAQIYVLHDPFSPCQIQYPIYSTSPPIGSLETDVSDMTIAEDFASALAPSGETCLLNGYEVAFRGLSGGSLSAKTDLRQAFSDVSIPGTQMTVSGYADGRPVIRRHLVDPKLNIVVPATSLLMTWETKSVFSSLMFADGPVVGWTDPFYEVVQCTSAPCQWPIGRRNGTYYLKVFCRGAEAIGSCCTLDSGQVAAVCTDDLTAQGCAGNRWLSNDQCADSSLDPPCGVGACCTPSNSCIDLPSVDCVAMGGQWNSGDTCATAASSCGHFACQLADGECSQTHESPGCNFRSCCNAVCDVDPTCCTESWDVECLRLAGAQLECARIPKGAYCSSSYFSPGNSAIWIGAQSQITFDNSFSNSGANICCATPSAFPVGGMNFRFVAASASARISSCNTTPGDAGDSILQVYHVGDSSSDALACSTLSIIACNDDRPGCGDGTMSDLCVTGLTPGETYYFTFASKTAADRGIYQITLESPCPAAQLAGPCNEGIIRWLAPVSNTVVDARQPFDPDDPNVPQGISSLIVAAPLHADDPACWTLCDTLGNPFDNEVLAIDDNGDGSLTLHLQSPITPGAATSISYVNSSGCTHTAGRFSNLPGDIGGQSGVHASDGTNFAFWCLSSAPDTIMDRCDIDRSGELTAADLIRLLDLMNGAGPFDPWLGRKVSTAPCE